MCGFSKVVWCQHSLNLFYSPGEVRVPAIENGGGQGGQGGGGDGGGGGGGGTPGPALQDQQPGEKREDQMSKKPTRRPGVKPPPDRAKRSIYLFSLKNPIRQLFIKVNLNTKYVKGIVCFDNSTTLLLA